MPPHQKAHTEPVVLLVAPATDLLYIAEEVQAIVNTTGLAVRLLQGAVAERDIGEALSRGRYDCLWLATHGNEHGVLLSNNATLPTSALTALVRGHAIPFVVLNTCSSLLTAMQINQEAHADVVATVSEVPDVEAYRTGVLLAHHLGLGSTPRAAYEASKPGGNRTYIYLSRCGEDSQTASHATLDRRIAALEADVRKLWRAINPSLRQMVSRAIFYALLMALWSLWLIDDIQLWLVLHPGPAVAITLVVLIAAAVVRWLPENDDD